ncbi:hypothetical protein E2C01_023629 [Portunus trituberculatus]|uniref:Uncharacterized protein n=1 Tax=Portunus trituberculatus TaxID=210409 RepID=A0A5B7E9K8_PORTR|nr:hypothetical protein [Portunus trituberculatus]
MVTPAKASGSSLRLLSVMLRREIFPVIHLPVSPFFMETDFSDTEAPAEPSTTMASGHGLAFSIISSMVTESSWKHKNRGASTILKRKDTGLYDFIFLTEVPEIHRL